MGLTPARKIRTTCHNCLKLRFRVALLLVVALTGCNSCVTFTSNPPTGTLGIVASDPRPVCTLPKMNAAVRLQLATEPACSFCSGSGQVQHIFISIRGIELNPSAAARDDSPDWQELLLPELEQKPLQIDLLESNAVQGIREPFVKTAPFPAGIYRQLRLRLAPDQAATDDRLPEKNPCGSGKFNCVVMADGNIQPLRPNEDSPELRITSNTMEGASLLFPPDTDTDLLIELNLVWEWSSSADTVIRLAPVLTGSAKVRRFKLDELGTPEDGVVNDSRSR
ncbi:MAG TPA: DUF4382 domain-containing protein [Candidatus Acidoferrales bacterium]|jgi:hypothetical protein|nr:DUF4382 domain-containing protein [Candidatus Acidoferrales bacterium]